jgi:hypothetical protein
MKCGDREEEGLTWPPREVQAAEHSGHKGLNIIQSTHNNELANTTLNRETISPTLNKETGCSRIPFLFNILLELEARMIKQEEEMQIGRSQIIPFGDEVILTYVEKRQPH